MFSFCDIACFYFIFWSWRSNPKTSHMQGFIIELHDCQLSLIFKVSSQLLNSWIWRLLQIEGPPCIRRAIHMHYDRQGMRFLPGLYKQGPGFMQTPSPAIKPKPKVLVWHISCDKHCLLLLYLVLSGFCFSSMVFIFFCLWKIGVSFVLSYRHSTFTVELPLNLGGNDLCFSVKIKFMSVSQRIRDIAYF